MARPLRIIYPGAFYHVTSIGNERKAVFKSKRDREKSLEYLESAAERYQNKSLAEPQRSQREKKILWASPKKGKIIHAYIKLHPPS